MLYFILLLIILFFILFICNEYYTKYESFTTGINTKRCLGNDFCNGNKQSLCIYNKCLPCGLQKSCTKDSECGPNNCIDGCCDSL